MMTQTATQGTGAQHAYLMALVAQAQGAVPAALPLPALRATAAALVKEQTFPTTKQEDWRFTDLSPMLAVPFQAVRAIPAIAPTDLPPAVQLPEVETRLVFVNGHYSPELSQVGALPEGIRVGSLAVILETDGGDRLCQRLGQQSGSPEVFTALNTLGFADAAVIWLPRNAKLDAPISVVYLSIPGAIAPLAQPRCLVVAESGSTVTLIEDFYGEGAEDCFTNAVTEIWVDDNARVHHVRLQREGSGTFHIGKTAVTQGRDSTYHGTAISLGARIARHPWEMYQTGPQTETQLHGLSAIAGSQTADTHSLIALTHPHGTANQLHKCLVDGKAHAIFNGKIWVAREAQMTQASQLNRNLLLSSQGRIDTKPELDIVADNVKCAHGATVSQLDANEIFYLQSRGISADQAQHLLIYGFVMEILTLIPIPSLREALMQSIIS